MNRKHQQVQPTELHHRQLQTIQQRKLSKNKKKKKKKKQAAHVCNTSASQHSGLVLVQLVLI